jgi:alpha-N-arabinofuranosidase
VSSSVSYEPARPGDKAGLIAFQNDDFYYLLAVTLSGEGRPVVQLEKRQENSPAIRPWWLAEAPEAADGAPSS